jgi:flagellar basal-body rod protein FlgB
MEASGVSALLYKQLGYRGDKQKVISGNIANINTPNYKAKELVFEEELQKAKESNNRLALARKMIPNAHKIMIAGGREVMFGEDQYECLRRGANAVVIGDYLTTEGKTPADDIKAIEDLGFNIADTCDR